MENNNTTQNQSRVDRHNNKIDMKNKQKYQIIENVTDHIGYNNEPVTIAKHLPENYFIVENENGNVWKVGEEEIKPFNAELEALRNMVNSIGLTEMKVYQKHFEDSRRTTKKYFANIGNNTISPVLDFKNLNHFLIGFLKAKQLLTN